MTRTGVIKAALATTALAAAALLVVLARGASAVEAEVRALASPTARLQLADDPDLPDFGPADQAARAILGVDDDLDFRAALGLIERSRSLDHLPSRVIELHAQAVALLLPLVESSEPKRASLASSLVGGLYAEDLSIDPDGAGRYAEQAVDAFGRAVLLDSSNESAKFGLELILRRLAFGADITLDEGRGGGLTGAGDVPRGTGY